MRRLTTIILTAFLSVAIYAGDITTFCAIVKSKNIEGVTSTMLGKVMLKMMGEKGTIGIPETGSVNMGAFFDKIEQLMVINAPDANVAKRMRPVIQSLLNVDGYETLIDVMDDKGHTVILFKKHCETINEIVTIADEKKQITIVDFLGNINFDDMQNGVF